MNANYYNKVIVDEYLFSNSKRLQSGFVIWRNRDSLEKLSDERFYNKFSYVLPDTDCFSGTSFEKSTWRKLYFDRYGGEGVGRNGGSGRCGVIDGYQVKGVGATPLVGDHDNKEHSYGGLDVRKAAIETIFSVVLNKILPCGVVEVHGLIFVGSKTAMTGKKKTWGCLMVRDACIRPGHFMRAANFKPRKEFRSMMRGDLARIRLIFKEMARQSHHNHAKFVEWLGACLKNIADQFAFSRVMRISHGTMTASNISVSGKWLDLPACSFLTGGVNYKIFSQFYEEHNMALNYIMEIFHNYAKYNRLVMNPDPLVSYFHEQFEAYCRHHVRFILGLDAKVEEFSGNEWELIVDTFLKAVHAGDVIEPRRPCLGEEDPVAHLAVAFYHAVSESSCYEYYADRASLSKSDAANFKIAAQVVMASYCKERRNNDVEVKALFKSLFFISMKRVFLTEIWYLTNIEEQVTKICKYGTPKDIGCLISVHDEVSSWVFEEIQDRITIFSYDQVQAYYDVKADVYYLHSLGCVTHFQKFGQMKAAIFEHSVLFSCEIYNFEAFFIRLETLVGSLEMEGLPYEYGGDLSA